MHDPDLDLAQLDALRRGLHKLKDHGGPGDPTVALVGGESLTVGHTVAREVAERAVAIVAEREGRPLHLIPLLAFYDVTNALCQGRQTTPAKARAEVGRILNRAHREARHGR